MTTPHLDSRIAMYIAGFDQRTGAPTEMTAARHAEITSTWPATAATPEGIAAQLTLTRDLYAHGAYVYEFLTVAAHYALLVLEAALSTRLDIRGKGMQDLIKKAHQQDLIDNDEKERLDEGARKLRNGFSHPTAEPTIFNPAMAAGIIRASHELVAKLYPDLEPS